MQNGKQLFPAAISLNTRLTRLINSAANTVTVFFILIQLPSLTIAGQTESEQLVVQERLLSYEIAGISLNTPIKTIPPILESHGYTQTGNTTYTKQIQVPGQRKSIYRIEIDDTPAQRQIIYFRGKSGGRVKSSALRDKPVQPDEAEMANTLYQLVCTEVTPKIQETRNCEPMTDALIIFGNGEFLDVGKNISAQLNVSADSTTIGIKYNKK